MGNVSIKFSRSKFIENTRTAAIIRLDSALHKVGQPVIVRYKAPIGHDGPNEVNTIFAIGIKDGTGRDCYDIVSLGEHNLVQGISDKLPDASSLIRGETYLFRDSTTQLGYKVFLVNGERAIVPLTNETRIYTNVEDDYTWFLTDGVLKREDEFYSRVEIDALLFKLKEEIADSLSSAIGDLDDRVKEIEEWMTGKDIVDNPPRVLIENKTGNLFLTGTTKSITFKVSVTRGNLDVTDDYSLSISGREIILDSDGEVTITGVKATTTYVIQATHRTTGDIIKGSSTVNFGYNFYYGVIPSSGWDSTEDNVKSLTNVVLSIKTGISDTFSLDLEKISFCCPAVYGELESIKDSNGFDYLGEYDVVNLFIDGYPYYNYIKRSEVRIDKFRQDFYY